MNDTANNFYILIQLRIIQSEYALSQRISCEMKTRQTVYVDIKNRVVTDG